MSNKMYLGIQKGKIKFYSEYPLNKTLYNLDEIIETNDIYVLDEDNQEYVLKDEEYIKKELQKVKQLKSIEASNKAKEYIESGNALFEFQENMHIEATDGNIAKLTAYALAFVTGKLNPETDTVIWNTKEDETVKLNQIQITNILNGLGNVQANVWSIQFTEYIKLINEAKTIEELENIVIKYEDIID